MALRIARKKNKITLPCGVEYIVKELVGKHQRLLTEQRTKKHDKMNMLLADVIESVDGVDYESMTEIERLKFVRLMLGSDRKYILTEARQLAMSHNPTFEFKYEWKESDGTPYEQLYEFSLIDEVNQESVIEKIMARAKDIVFVGEELEPEEYEERLKGLVYSLNRIGCFATKPNKEIYSSYADVLESKRKEIQIDILPEYRFDFSMIDGALEETIKINDLSSHTRILCRKPRYMDTGEKEIRWRKLTSEDLDGLGLTTIDELRRAMDDYEGGVDTIEQFDNPDETKGGKVTIDLVGEISFFFPSGQV